MRIRIRRALLAGATAASLGCGHSDPFALAADPGLDSPHSNTPPTQLTFDDGMDRFATWSPDEKTIWYSFQPGDRSDGDVCLATMPAIGGTRNEYCAQSQASLSMRDAYERATPGPDRQLVYGRYTSNIGMLTLYLGWLELASVDAPLLGRPLLSLPNHIDGVGFNHVGRIQWLASDHLIAVAEDETVVPHCTGCAKRDTIFIGLGLLDGRITPTGATFSLIPGTRQASDFFLSPARDSIYFTQSEDPDNITGRSALLSRVPVAGGNPEVVYTAPGPMFSVSRAGARVMVALPNRVLAVDLATGATNQIVNNGLNARGYGTVTSTADGCRVLAEFGKPRSVTFVTDIYLLTSALTGCAQ